MFFELIVNYERARIFFYFGQNQFNIFFLILTYKGHSKLIEVETSHFS
jgi:hypothetical protein